jgi:predicted nuclease with TOPRIM domain
MDLTKIKEQKLSEMNSVSTRINQLESEKSNLIPELLRLEGEMRLINQLTEVSDE